MMINIINFLKKKNRIKRLTLFTISQFLSALVFNVILDPKNILIGGTTSLAIILKNYINIESSTLVIIFSLLLLILCYIFLGKKMTLRSIFGTIIYAVFTKLTLPLVEIFDLSNIDNILSIIYGGVIIGFCNGMIIKIGYSGGGFQILYQIANKYFKISIGNANLIINSILILIGSFIFGITHTFYAIIIIFISNFITDRVILGVSESKNFYVITTKEKEIREYLINDVNNTFTLVEVKGGYSNKNKKMLVCAIPTIEYPKVKEIIKEIDNKAFFLITDTYELSKKSI